MKISALQSMTQTYANRHACGFSLFNDVSNQGFKICRGQFTFRQDDKTKTVVFPNDLEKIILGHFSLRNKTAFLAVDANGDFYLIKVWALTVFLGPILSTFLSFILFNKGEKLNEELFVFIFIQIVFGIFLCLPSLVISEIFYKTISKKDLNDNNVFYYTILISLLTTSLTYIIFFGRTDDYSIVFSISYSAILILGFFYFKNSDKHQLTTDKQNI